MRTDGERHPIDFFKENIYDLVTVTQENYAQYAAAGIYKNIDKIYINNGIKKIKFRYYSPDNTLIEADSVPVIYDGLKGDPGIDGINGTNGDRGPYYRGTGSNDSLITDPVENDYYLNISDGCIHKYQSGTWITISDVSQAATEYNTALQDGVKYFTSLPSTAPVVAAFNVWAKNVFAQSAVINEIFTQHITVSQKGWIESAGYVDGMTSQGFHLDAGGKFKCYEGEFYNGIFNGELNCGQLRVNKQSYVTTWFNWQNIKVGPYSLNDFGNSGTLVYNLYAQLGITLPVPSRVSFRNDQTAVTVEKLYGKSGSFIYNGNKYKYIDMKYRCGGNSAIPIEMFSFDIYNDPEYVIEVASYDYGSGYKGAATVSIKAVSESGTSLMMQLINVPDSKPDTAGLIYRSGNNLCIS